METPSTTEIEALALSLYRKHKSALKEEVEALSAYVLESPCCKSVEHVADFQVRHNATQEELKKTQELIPKLECATETFHAYEKLYAERKRIISNLTKSLKKFYQPLGSKAFASHKQKEIETHKFFDERVDLEEVINELKREKAQLTTHEANGIIAKTKILARLALLTGKIGFESTKCEDLEKEIGKKLINEECEDEVRCSGTEEVLASVSKVRASIATEDHAIAIANDHHRAEQRKAANFLFACKEFRFPDSINKSSLKKRLKQEKKLRRSLENEARQIVDDLGFAAIMLNCPVSDERYFNLSRALKKKYAYEIEAARQRKEQVREFCDGAVAVTSAIASVAGPIAGQAIGQQINQATGNPTQRQSGYRGQSQSYGGAIPLPSTASSEPQQPQRLPVALQGCVLRRVSGHTALFSHKCETCGWVDSSTFTVSVGGSGVDSGGFLCHACKRQQPCRVQR